MIFEPALLLWGFTHVASAVYCGLTARVQRRSILVWSLLGLVLSLVAVMLVHVLGRRMPRAQDELEHLREKNVLLRHKLGEQRHELVHLRSRVAAQRARDKRREQQAAAELVDEARWTDDQRRLWAWAAEHDWPAIGRPGLMPVDAGTGSWRRLVGASHPQIVARVMHDLLVENQDQAVRSDAPPPAQASAVDDDHPQTDRDREVRTHETSA